MTSSKPSSSSGKRKAQWPDVVSPVFSSAINTPYSRNDVHMQEDSFSTSKKQRVVKVDASSSVSLHDFMMPAFEPRPQSAKGKEKMPSTSLHAAASNLLFKKENKTAPLKSSHSLVQPDTPKVPKLITAESNAPTPAKNLISVLNMVPPRLGHVSNVNTPSKPLKSVLRTPLIAGAFSSPPKSQTLTIPVADILYDEGSELHPMQAELNRGLAPSPEKGAFASRKQFVRQVQNI
jgi:hypothetical protein